MWLSRKRRKEDGEIDRRHLDEGPVRAQIARMPKMARISLRTDGALPSMAALLLPYLAALAMVALSTVLGALIAPSWGNSPVDLLYVPTILATAILFGLRPALLAGLGSALAYNFFFTSPFHSFRVSRPADIVTVVVLFLVAVVTSKLAASVREQAALARAHASRNATIAGFAARLLSGRDRQEVAVITCGELSHIFGCNTAMLAGLPHPAIMASLPDNLPIAPSEAATAAAVLESGESAGRGARHPYPTDWQFHPIASGERVIATVGLVRDDELPAVSAEQQELLRSLLDQSALALERTRLEREAQDHAALRQRDATRAALLATIGRDLEPPIRALSASLGQLRRDGAGAKDVLAAMGASVTAVERYLSNLIELEPEAGQQPVEVNGVAIDLAQRRVTRNGNEVHLTPKEYAVLAELAKRPGRVITHAHLLRSAWGPAQESQTEYLRVAIRGLRQKLERDPAHPEMIKNEPSVGYRLVC